MLLMARSFGHQLKAIRDDRCKCQIFDYIGNFERVYQFASLSHTSNPNVTGYAVTAAWSRTAQKPDSDVLNVVITVPNPDEAYRACVPEDVIAGVALSLDPLISEIEHRKPQRISFLLFLNGTNDLITNLASACFPLAEHSHDHYLDVVIAEIVRLFRESNEYTPCDYLTIWNDSAMFEHIYSPISTVANKGQVVVERGIFRAKLLPMNT